MTKQCCRVHFRIFRENNDYTSLESFIMNLLSLCTTKNPRKSAKIIRVLKEQAKMVYNCCNEPSKLGHSFGELHEHVKYVNRDNIANAKKVWTRENKKEKK